MQTPRLYEYESQKDTLDEFTATFKKRGNHDLFHEAHEKSRQELE